MNLSYLLISNNHRIFTSLVHNQYNEHKCSFLPDYSKLPKSVISLYERTRALIILNVGLAVEPKSIIFL